MATNDSGYNESAAVQEPETVISGGITVHLFGGGSTLNYSDTATEISNKSDASVNVARTALTVTTPADFTGVTTLENDNVIDFGSQSIGTVDDIVIQSQSNTDRAIRADEPNNPDLTGEDVSIPANTVLYEFGNP